MRQKQNIHRGYRYRGYRNTKQWRTVKKLGSLLSAIEVAPQYNLD